MKIAIPDLISNSYFPAAAAVELGFFKEEGLDASIDLIFPVGKCYEELRDGNIDFVAGSAHSALAAFPGWKGVKLIAAQGQGMYWFLVMNKALGRRTRRTRHRQRQTYRRRTMGRYGFETSAHRSRLRP